MNEGALYALKVAKGNAETASKKNIQNAGLQESQALEFKIEAHNVREGVRAACVWSMKGSV